MGTPHLLPFYLLSLPLFFSTALMTNHTNGTTTITNSVGAAVPSSSQPRPQNLTPFRPSIAVIVGVLTTMFSITFLLLLYAKHCKRGHISTGSTYIGNPNGPTSGSTRKNSGIDRAVIESLPIFRFASLRGQKEGLECAVCLTRFEPTEVLRLLPKCKHAFHVECVDTWLDAHSTCPLCRYRVDPEDVLLLVEHPKLGDELSTDDHQKTESETRNESAGTEFRRVSGRHSSAGERASQYSLQVLVQRPSESESGESCWGSRRSLDSAKKKRDAIVNVGCFDHRSSGRKDGLLMVQPEGDTWHDRERFMKRFEHRIVLSRDGGGGGGGGAHRRWSDLRPSDLLFLQQSEMIVSNGGSRRYSSVSSSVVKQEEEKSTELMSGRSVINGRCVSEITGLSRFAK